MRREDGVSIAIDSIVGELAGEVDSYIEWLARTMGAGGLPWRRLPVPR